MEREREGRKREGEKSRAVGWVRKKYTLKPLKEV